MSRCAMPERVDRETRGAECPANRTYQSPASTAIPPDDLRRELCELSFLRHFSTIQSSPSLIVAEPVDKLRVLITRERIAAKVAGMGQRIS
jgi:hypothetical protein